MTDTTGVLKEACARAGLDASDAALLHQHAATLYLLRADRVVVRLNRNLQGCRHSSVAVELTRWLTEQGFPSVVPIEVEQPIDLGSHCVTFWRYYPQNDRPKPTADHLGAMLRQLHSLPTPPVQLQPYQPLRSLGNSVEASTSLPDRDRTWLLAQRNELVGEYAQLDFPLGYGWIHGDAYPGNTLWDDDRALLGDWDEAGTGPRELDLVNTHQGVRVGRPRAEREAFTAAYGYDVTEWSGFPVLRAMRDLHTLGVYIRLADAGDEKSAAELAFRLNTLHRGDIDARWNPR